MTDERLREILEGMRAGCPSSMGLQDYDSNCKGGCSGDMANGCWANAIEMELDGDCL